MTCEVIGPVSHFKANRHRENRSGQILQTWKSLLISWLCAVYSDPVMWQFACLTSSNPNFNSHFTPFTPQVLNSRVLPLSKCCTLPSHAPCFKALLGFQQQYSTSNSARWGKLLSGIIPHA